MEYHAGFSSRSDAIGLIPVRCDGEVQQPAPSPNPQLGNDRMKFPRATLLLSTFAVLATTPTSAQEASDSPVTTPTEQAPAALVFSTLRLGATATVLDTAGNRLGSARNHVIDRKSGRVLAIVLETGVAGSTGHRTVAVPFASFAWDMEKHDLVLPMQTAELAALPEFDASAIATFDAPPASEAKPIEASANDQPDGAPAGSTRPRNLASASILEINVLGAGERFGQVTELILDPQRGEIAFLVVQGGVPSAHGLRYVIPWAAVEWEATPNAEVGAGTFTIPMSAPELAEAPKLESGGIRILEKPEERGAHPPLLRPRTSDERAGARA